jgi:DNA polymerase III subunit delta
MVETPPIVYILHGEDEYGITQTLKELESHLGDPTNAALNTTRLEGAGFKMEELLSVATAMPFLARRRLVILNKVLARVDQVVQGREKFLELLEKVPPSTALIIIEDHTLRNPKSGKKDEPHWVVAWAENAGKRVYVKPFPLLKGSDWNKRIHEMAKRAGGQISPRAAELLYSLVDGDLRLADQEVQKLVAYANYTRPVDVDDVQALTADVGQGDIFILVDAMGNRDGKKALQMLRRLMEYQDTLSIFGMVVRQFRLLVQTRAILDEGGGASEILQRLTKSAYLADKLILQARKFSLDDLKQVYHKLLDIDEAQKTSQVPGELALEMLVTALAIN